MPTNIVKLSLKANRLEPTSRPLACFGNSKRGRCLLLGMTVSTAVTLLLWGSSNKSTLIKWQSHVALRLVPFIGSTRFLTV